MSLVRQCDRCGKQTLHNSLNAGEFRAISIQKLEGGVLRSKEFCKDCVIALEEWWKPINEHAG